VVDGVSVGIDGGIGDGGGKLRVGGRGDVGNVFFVGILAATGLWENLIAIESIVFI